eukprot:CAMPEP_0172603302 /NCGR_PEP_ID=MMETSP1068-20121228/23529_1 /TAXON_ID=35684 /ORGANISM="Pseudopedinella elastica, Strain CCMP716" /LENGTH=489 /DNA_ID=CAMNT_0013404991 /DNA_START=330 /DNA_END=1799 /DNA_ORIENTATION=+
MNRCMFFLCWQVETQALLSGRPLKQPSSFPEEDFKTKAAQEWLGIGYMMAMGVCGVVLTAIGSTLDALAFQCDTTPTAIGSVFVARGCGAIVGAVSSAKFYAPPAKGNQVLVAALGGLVALLLYLPFTTDIVALHAAFAGLGFGTAVTDTGCQIMTRKVHGKEAGPWLGANTVVFGVAGALVPVISLATDSLLAIFGIIASVALATLATIGSAPHPEFEPTQDANPSSDPALKQAAGATARQETKAVQVAPWVDKYYVTEMLIGQMVFWFIGGKVLVSSYVEDFVLDSGVVDKSSKDLALLAVWVAIAVGRFGGLYDQIQINSLGVKGVHPLYGHLTLWIWCGVIGGSLWASFPKSPWAFWAGVILYGFGNGPCVGYCYDLNNRLTVASEAGMSIVMFGLNFGASLVPYLTTLAWDHTALGFHVLPLATTLSMALPLPLLYLTRPLNDVAAIGRKAATDAKYYGSQDPSTPRKSGYQASCASESEKLLE